eukprot:CAMPEP_0197827572 /NCGR_PEP_ID=MMETSP1437-20131217/4323_1 /TAXON_ID=49252 ORGANISM="Eucampia antarctica, Strain CCMP1452" /NCGR_SAMPLE_ID=MMETSP1437 /ASSEMBLY_ACC=CAM_ASM_001096 /LENGTH=108 /DNA_ID=CAMNT_0043428467 /DNA_START=28 /DNA_END=354 /DNA_ORIENTATION=+
MIEDRHSFSEPRIASNSGGNSGNDVIGGGGGGSCSSLGEELLLLAWEVDVFRKGVDGPVDTLRVHDRNLPPRVNKKGKTVWRLPHDKDRLVRKKNHPHVFGTTVSSLE